MNKYVLISLRFEPEIVESYWKPVNVLVDQIILKGPCELDSTKTQTQVSKKMNNELKFENCSSLIRSKRSSACGAVGGVKFSARGCMTVCSSVLVQTKLGTTSGQQTDGRFGRCLCPLPRVIILY